MFTMKNHSYEEDLDILYIYNNPKDEKVSGNLILGNMILDVGENGKVLGIEIDCASKFFRFPSEQIKELQIAKIEVTKFSNMITLGLILSTKIKEYHFQFAVPQKNNAPIAFC